MDARCVACGQPIAAAGLERAQPGDVFETFADKTWIYDWRGAIATPLRAWPTGTRLALVDQLPAPWWKVAVHPGRFRALTEQGELLYPDVLSGELRRVGGLCVTHLAEVRREVARSDPWSAFSPRY